MLQENSFLMIVEALNKMIEKYNPDSEWEYLSIGGNHKSIKLKMEILLWLVGN